MRALQYLSVSLTFARLILALVTAGLILYEVPGSVIISLIVLIIVSDIADGILYRKSGKPDTGFRRILDSVADKGSMFMVASTTIIVANNPFVVAIAIIAEVIISDISIAAFGKGIMLKPTLLGKIGCVLFATLCIAALYCNSLIAYLALIVFLTFRVPAIVSYFRQYLSLQKRRP